jgi:hypothetical protein
LFQPPKIKISLLFNTKAPGLAVLNGKLTQILSQAEFSAVKSNTSID